DCKHRHDGHTSPTGGSVPSGPLTIKANVVSGTNPIAHVDFLVNGTVKCSDTSSPYTCVWNVPSARGKSYQLQVKAHDTAVQAGVSPIVTVTHCELRHSALGIGSESRSTNTTSCSDVDNDVV